MTSIRALFGAATKGEPLARVKAIDKLVERLRAEQLDLVDQARQQGASWADVGQAVGTSRQAAQERFSR